MEILQIENLSFKYPQAEKKALENVNLTIEEGSFNVICGESGCGKTTLLKMIKKEISPFGEKDGDIYFNKIKIENLTERQSASEIGFVFQNPDNQIVTDKVWHELAFGLENLGVENNVIRRKVGEMASYFGIESWFRKNTDELSGGEKQLLNLASIMVMQPNLLILDEPTSQLDPIAASEFISTLQKMNKEFGLTIMLVEHRLEEVFPIADKIILMENGKILLYETPQKTANKLKEISKEHKMLLGMPSAIRIFNNLNINDKCPLTVKEGKSFLLKHFNNEKEKFFLPKQYFPNENVAVELKEAWFCYGKNSQDVLRGANLKIYNSEIFVILGGNGTGKTTALNIISGLLKTYKGKVKINGKKINTYKDNSLYDFLALLPQNPQTVFLKNTVNEDLEEILNLKSFSKNEKEKLKNEIINQFGISSLLFKH
ncbi:MAG: ABC transporter ATP-binding protein, partial [Clostridia bacterium]